MSRMMKTIYIVTSGCYSDYSIDAVFSTKEKAEAYIVSLNEPKDKYGPSQIEEYELDEDGDYLVSGGKYWDVEMDKEGNVVDVKLGRHSAKDGWWNCYSQIFYVGSIAARDAEHAVKIANEKRIAYVNKCNLEGRIPYPDFYNSFKHA